MNGRAPAASRRVPRKTVLAILASLAAAMALVVLVHRLLASSADGQAALFVAVAWLAGCAVVASLGSRRPLPGLLLTALGVAMVLRYQDLLVGQVERIYLIQHAGMHALLGLWFGATLRAAAGEALVTRLATRVHGPLPAPIRRYTRQVTLAWTVYFAVMAILSVGLYLSAPLATWSVFANLLTLPLTVGFFVAEYLVRLRLHPDFDHVSIFESIRAYRR